MALDPRISLAADAGNIGDIFSNALSTAQQAQTLQQNRALAPIQNQLLQAQAAQAQAGVEQSQQLNRVRSLAIYGQNAAPFLQSGDLEGLREFTVNRSGELAAQGTPNNDTADVLAIIDNPTVSREQKIQGLSELAARAQQNAISLGAIESPEALSNRFSATTVNLPGGLTVQSTTGGDKVVTDGAGNVLSGQVAIDAIREAEERDIETQRLRSAARTEGTATETRISDLIGRGTAAAESTATIRRAITLLDQVATGGPAAISLAVKQRLGIEGADEGELSNSLGKAVLSQLRETFGAAFTETEGARLERIEAGFTKSPATNKRLLQQALRVAESTALRASKAAKDRGTGEDLDIEDLLSFSLDIEEPVTAAPAGMTDNGDGTFTLPDGRIVRRIGG